ncbi:hypothetical protein EFQ99_31455 [Rhizobium vallis]|uniref:Uncharacterized protein n=1 Tax=Rhizobium vallis TaxID=634290 RepID=A0A432PC73_9HYPH|nr:hypothetical protein [Rhizobium vallis]RUM19287.1 hypothetical protein EFQ99_31455 [Rhizobium vallis]
MRYLLGEPVLDIIMALRAGVSNSQHVDLDTALEIAPRLEVLRQLVIRNHHILDDASLSRMLTEIEAIDSSTSFMRLDLVSLVVRDRMRPGKKETRNDIRTTFTAALKLLLNHVRDAEQLGTELDGSAAVPRELAPPDKRTIDRLVNLVPEQKLAPVQFKIHEGFLSVDHQPSVASNRDIKSADSAREALVSQGKTVVEELGRSNCDTRFLETIISLQSKLEAADDVIQLGILNISCDEMAKRYDAELSGAVAARLRAHINSVAAYVAQFPDWRRYTENAAVVELDESDIRKSVGIADEIVSSLSDEPELIDPEVPHTIKLIKEAVGDPNRALKRTSYALFRTLENLFSKVFEFGAAFASDLATQTSTRLAKWGSRAVAGGLITLVLGWAGALTPIFQRLPDAGWLTPAISLMRTIGF